MREMALLTGEGSGKILHDVRGISADVWRENSKAREQREQDARRQQELLRHDPGAEPDRRNLI